MINETNELNELIQIPQDKRDQQWENHFFQALTDSRLKVLSPDPQLGPDNWPYLLVKTDTAGTEPTSKIISWLAEKGVGLVVNPDKDYPDYVFSYGMIWSFKQTGLFFRHDVGTQSGAVEYTSHKIQQSGDASVEYLPVFVRSILREFFRDQGLHRVKLLVLSLDAKNYDLCFSLESLGNPPQSEHAGIAEAIGWFLPPHYSIVLISEKELPAFYNL